MDLEISFLKDRYRIGEIVQLYVQFGSKCIRNTTPTKFTICFEGDEYFLSNTKNIVNLRESFCFLLHPRCSDLTLSAETIPKVIEALPSSIKVQVKDQNSRILTEALVPFTLQQFTEDLYQSKQALNVLLIGPTSSGKSSFINSCFTVLCSQVCLEIAQSGGGSQPVTNAVKSFRLVDLQSEVASQIRLWDSPGLSEDDNFSESELQKLLQGPVHLQQHAVLAFIAATDLLENDTLGTDGQLKSLSFAQTARMQGCPLFVVVTKQDRYNQYYSSQIIRRAATLFHVAPNKVFVLQNYVNQSTKQFKLDKAILKVLLAVMMKADEYAQAELFKETQRKQKEEQVQELISTVARLNQQVTRLQLGHRGSPTTFHNKFRVLGVAVGVFITGAIALLVSAKICLLE